MIANISRLFLCFVAIVCLAGCGGSSKSSSGGGGGSSPTIVTYTFNGPTPAAVATQVGTGAFTPATLQSGKLSISVPSGTTNFAVAWACPAVTFDVIAESTEFVDYASTLDSTSLYGFCESNAIATPQSSETLQVNAAAIPGAAYVIAGALSQQLAGNGSVSLTGQMNNGTYDVAVVVYDIDSRPLAVKILRSQTIPGTLNSGNPVVFAASDETTIQTVKYSNLPAGFSNEIPYDSFTTSGDAFLSLTSYEAPLPDNQFFAVPAGAVQSGDYYLLEFVATENAAPSSGGFESVGEIVYTSTPGSQTITYPSPWAYAGPTAAALPVFNFNYSGFSGQASVTQNAFLDWSVGTKLNYEIGLSATPNYQGGATSLAVPDLSALTGFLAPAASGSTVQWSTGIDQGLVSGTTPSGTLQFVSNNGSYTAP